MQSSNAFLSLSDRQGLDRLAASLRSRGFHLIATSGTAAAVRGMGIDCEDVGDLTGFPPLCDGRVKTLHPKVFAGILARRADVQDMTDLERYGIPPISVVAVTLYPFEKTMAGGASERELVEQIDVGGVTLLRAAAKNFSDVVVLSDPAQYEGYIVALERGGPSEDERRRWAAEAFARCETYDAAIAAYFGGGTGVADGTGAGAGIAGIGGADLPTVLRVSLPSALPLRYGENPWARAAFYRDGAGAPFPEQLSGKTLSYNNLLDVDACLRLLAPVEPPIGFPEAARSPRNVSAAIVKHTVPCGYAARDDAAGALAAALGADPISAFGGIVACSGRLDGEAARLLQSRFLEVVAAPAYDDEALAVLSAKKNLRVLRYAPELPQRLALLPKVRSALGGVLVEIPDAAAQDDAWKTVAGAVPSYAQWRDLLFAFGAVRVVKSNAAVVVSNEVTLGVCGGQTNRVAAVELACARAGSAARGAVLATDGFFPFPDGIEAAAARGIAAVVAPSGSIRDAEVVAAAQRLGITLVFAARRYFLH